MMIDKNSDEGNEVTDAIYADELSRIMGDDLLTVCSPGHPQHLDPLSGYCCNGQVDSSKVGPRCRHECCRDTWYDRHYEGSALQAAYKKTTQRRVDHQRERELDREREQRRREFRLRDIRKES